MKYLRQATINSTITTATDSANNVMCPPNVWNSNSFYQAQSCPSPRCCLQIVPFYVSDNGNHSFTSMGCRRLHWKDLMGCGFCGKLVAKKPISLSPCQLFSALWDPISPHQWIMLVLLYYLSSMPWLLLICFYTCRNRNQQQNDGIWNQRYGWVATTPWRWSKIKGISLWAGVRAITLLYGIISNVTL